MDNIEWALLIAWVVSLLVALLVARGVHRRLVRAERRATGAERLAELGTLTGRLAHEIKNPLSTVQLNLQLLKEDLDPAAAGYERLVGRLVTVQRETGRLRSILDDFERYGGKMTLDPQAVDLNELLDDLVDFFMPQAQLHRVQLRLFKSEQRFIVRADPKLLKQAVLNLMINALQAMGDQGGGELILRALRGPREARIHVIDTGRGIAPEALGRIFNAYYSTKQEGTGLGLAIAQRIATEHGGSLSVTSEPGKGSDFTLHLPME